MVTRKKGRAGLVLILTMVFLLASVGIANADLISGPAYYQGAGSFTSLDFSIIPADLIVSVDNNSPVTITLNQNYASTIDLENAINSHLTGAKVAISTIIYNPDIYRATFMTTTTGAARSIYVAGDAAPMLGLDTITPANGSMGATWKGAGMAQPQYFSASHPYSFKVSIDGGTEQTITLNSTYADITTLADAISSQLTGATAYYAGGGALAIRSNNPDPATSSVLVRASVDYTGFSAYYPGVDVAPPADTPAPALNPAPAPQAPISTPAPVPTPAPNYPSQLIQPGASGEAVNTVQDKLKKLGFDCGAVDGKFGPVTQNAIIRYQRANGLVADGIVGPITWGKLFGFNVGPYKNNVSLGNTKPAEIGGIQDKLISLGYKPGPLDGIFGNKTLEAIKAFQRAKGLVVDGIVGPITWQALFG